MASYQAALIALIVVHLSTFALTATRLVTQYLRRRHIWYDDVLAALAACGGLFTVGCLISMVLHAPAFRPQEYHMLFLSYFSVIWASRACLVMMTGHAIHKFALRVLARLFLLASMLINIGITYTILAIFLCAKDPTCSDVEPCPCVLKPTLVLCALITDVVADIGILAINFYVFAVVVKEFKARLSRRLLVYLGFSSSICTLTVNIVFWKSYMVSGSDDQVLIMCLSSAVTITSVLTTNMSVIVGFICRWLSIADIKDENPPKGIKRDVRNAQNIFALEIRVSSALSVSGDSSGDNGHSSIKTSP